MFTTNTEFNIYIEQMKIKHEFDTYIETISYFIENESDQEPEQVAKALNKKIIEEIEIEASKLGLLKNPLTKSNLFA